MSPEDRVRLRHMMEAADEAIGFTAGHSRTTLETDRKTLLAVIRCVEIIGEAATKISETVRCNTPDIPWAAMTGMRNRLIHAYFDIDVDVVWKTTSTELPALSARLKFLLND